MVEWLAADQLVTGSIPVESLFKCAGGVIVQLVECLPPKQMVVGSSPAYPLFFCL